MSKKGSKKVWKDFEVTKVKLNPEQAVLSCCDELARTDQDHYQCGDEGLCGGSSGSSSQS